ncbi:hypothetical protein Cob_v002848 [Colletotrichum orbiculare MAFF 240422]|uniref:Uncharacterized protein n=1 Tax=Colletotrichum orbiculare (strain 104-T / ATCC 96160 / CBS 514.97 / LARS 414 / MAFF 240422) TaxID=1213857 RepID=A0A484G1E3_COLOR|nr:hypothetical protein Cob_v002848 [Colletotrichum orbiculare MAFF 240422]
MLGSLSYLHVGTCVSSANGCIPSRPTWSFCSFLVPSFAIDLSRIETGLVDYQRERRRRYWASLISSRLLS